MKADFGHHMAINHCLCGTISVQLNDARLGWCIAWLKLVRPSPLRGAHSLPYALR